MGFCDLRTINIEPSGSPLGPHVGLWDLRTLILSPRPPRGAFGFKDPLYFEPSGSPPGLSGGTWGTLGFSSPHGALGLGGPIEPSLISPRALIILILYCEINQYFTAFNEIN